MQTCGTPPHDATRSTRSTRSIALSLMLVAVSAAGCASPPNETEILESIRDTTLIPMLGSYQENEQQLAISRFLENLDQYPEEISKILSASLDDPVYSDRTKLVAACLLALLKDDQGIGVLVKNMGSDSEGTQDLVRRHLATYGTRIIPVVAEILETGNPRARLNAAVILHDLCAQFGVTEGYERMWKRLEHEPESEVRFVLLTGIAGDSRPIATRRLTQSLSREDDELNRDISWGALCNRLQVPAEIAFDPSAPEEQRSQQILRFQSWLARVER